MLNSLANILQKRSGTQIKCFCNWPSKARTHRAGWCSGEAPVLYPEGNRLDSRPDNWLQWHFPCSLPSFRAISGQFDQRGYDSCLSNPHSNIYDYLQKLCKAT